MPADPPDSKRPAPARAQRPAIPPPLADATVADPARMRTADTAVHMPKRRPRGVPLAIAAAVIVACVAVLVIVLLRAR